MKVLGAVGRIGSGKDTVVKYIASRYSIPIVSIGDIAREIARSEGLRATRENLQKITEDRFRRFGKTFFIEETVKRIKAKRTRVAVITGVRSPIDVQTLRHHFGRDFILICVDADERVRFERLKRRGESRDPKAWQDFTKQDANEDRIFRLSEACRLADFNVDNNDGLEKLFRQVDKITGPVFQPK
jgi:dephospho-CoA kinase